LRNAADLHDIAFFRIEIYCLNSVTLLLPRAISAVIRFSRTELVTMKAVKAIPGVAVIGLAVVLLLGTASEAAFARGRGGHSGHRHSGGSRVAIGMVVAAPAFWYLPTSIYAPPVAATSTAPTVYIELGDAQSASGESAGGWWYYCEDSRAYYPYVRECAREWQAVAVTATPPSVPAAR
jgi:hypothetical protein